MRELVYYVAVSLDGCIAGPQDQFDAFLVEGGATTHAMGLPAMPSPYRYLEQIVFTHRELPPAENLRTTTEDPVAVVRALKEQPGADIWLCGGAQLATQLRGEIDRLVLKRQPLLFGAGVPLFAPGDYEPEPFAHVRTRTFDSGVSLTEYVRER